MTTPAARFVLDVSSVTGYLIDRPGGYDCFAVEITQTYARYLLKLIRTLRTLKQRLPEMYKLELWDWHGDYYAVDYEAETLPPGMTRVGNAEDLRLVPAGEPSRIECARLMVLDDGVHWAAYPKHGDLELETETLPREQIEAVASQPDDDAGGEEGSDRG